MQVNYAPCVKTGESSISRTLPARQISKQQTTFQARTRQLAYIHLSFEEGMPLLLFR